MAENSHTSPGATRVEAELMTLEGDVKIQNHNSASGGSLIRNNRGNQITATTTLTGESGLYDIVIGYYDPQGGAAQYVATLVGNELDTWVASQDLASRKNLHHAAVTRTLEGILLDKGDTFSLQAIKNNKDKGYIDYVEFIPVVDEEAVSSETGLTKDIAPPSSKTGSTDVTLQLEVEHMELSETARIEVQDFASAGQYVRVWLFLSKGLSRSSVNLLRCC